MLFEYRFRSYYKIHTRDLVLNPDQWTQQKKHEERGESENFGHHDPKIGGFHINKWSGQQIQLDIKTIKFNAGEIFNKI